MRLAFGVLALVLGGPGCGNSGPASPTPITPGQSFELRVGGAAELSGGALRLVFERLVGDSRCPVDVTCIWAGDATIELKVSAGGSEPEALELHSATNLGNQVVRAGHRIKLTAVAPAPRSDVRLKPSDYRITLLVSAE